MKTEMVFETLVFQPFNHMTQLIAWVNFIILNLWESDRSYNFVTILHLLKKNQSYGTFVLSEKYKNLITFII
jgi:hypothetical protein